MFEDISKRLMQQLEALKNLLLPDPKKKKEINTKEVLDELIVLEKELREIDGNIRELKILVELCRKQYQELNPETHKTAEQEKIENQCLSFYEKLESWLRQEIRQKMMVTENTADEDKVERIAVSMMMKAKYRLDSEHLAEHCEEERPHLEMTLEEIKSNDLFSVGLSQIVWQLVINFELLKEKMDFEQWLNFYREFWKNEI